MTVLVAQLGARRHYAAPRALYAAGMLEGLVTDLCADGAPWRQMRAVLPARARLGPLKRILGRDGTGLPPRMIRNLDGFALSPALRPRQGEAKTDHWARRNAAFGRAVVKAGFGRADTAYGFNAAALEIFEAARARGLATILDQTAAPWRFNAALLQAEAHAFPDWEAAPAEIDVSRRLAEREEAEWSLADMIVCGSAFAADAVAACGGPRDRCVVIPYAGHVPAPDATHADMVAGERTDPAARVLFAGALQLRKGVQYLVQAMEALADTQIQFRLAGKSMLSDKALSHLTGRAEWVGAVPRAGMSAQYRWADIFVLPTLSEGSANVVYEAMSAGLAVITTPNAGSIVRDGVTGLIVPARDAAALAASIRLLAEDKDLRNRLSAAAAAEMARLSIEDYARALGAAAGRLKCES